VSWGRLRTKHDVKESSKELVQGVNVEFSEGKIMRGMESAEGNAGLAFALPLMINDLRCNTGFGIGLRWLRLARGYVGEPPEDSKINCRHMFLFNGLHLQGIILRDGCAGDTAGNKTVNRHYSRNNQDHERDR